ncbi:hypothetical protein AtDm6_0849 [Acetobacter tropicalis]|uniref:Uncharacterized protein n=1 Tax=Acetobacter tropicalis TaxID=104102 RepID=A0A095B8S4_9PROT|nr:hypothetical protein AtDm6_0849 [Acetobacter tropicalis]
MICVWQTIGTVFSLLRQKKKRVRKGGQLYRTTPFPLSS